MIKPMMVSEVQIVNGMDFGERMTGDVVIVDVRGAIERDSGAHAILLDRLRALIEQGYTCILLNLAQVTYIDSVFLGAVVQSYASAIRRGGTLKLVHVTKRLRELLAITKLDTVLEMFDSEEAATASVRPPAPDRASPRS